MESASAAQAPMNRCLVVESRFSSRKEIVKDLESTALFAEVVPATSAAEGKALLRSDNLDAGVFGPALSMETTFGLLQAARENNRDSHCTLIVIRYEDSPQENELLNSGAHAVVRWPYTPGEFVDGVTGAISKNRGQESAQQTTAIAATRSESSSRPTAPAWVARTSGSLRRLADGAAKGEFLLDALGRPTRKTAAEIEHVLNTAFLGNEADDIDRLKTELRGALRSWFEDLHYEGENSATTRLRQKLLLIAGVTGTKASAPAEG